MVTSLCPIVSSTRPEHIFAGRKQLNQFITRLDKEGSIRGGNVDLAARSARAKQEVEVAGGSIHLGSFSSLTN